MELTTGLQKLKEAEELAIEGARMYLAGRDQIAIALHRIATQKLYLEILDDKGLPMYKTFEAYWPDIKQKMGGVSRASAYNLLGDVRIALGPSFGLSYERFVELGGTTAFEAVKDVAEINQKTGEIIGLKQGFEVPAGQSVSTFILDYMQENAPSNVSELNLSIADYREGLRDKLQTGETVEIQWYLVKQQDTRGTYYKTKWERTLKNNGEVVNLSEGFIDNVNVPVDVFDAYNKRLPISGVYER